MTSIMISSVSQQVPQVLVLSLICQLALGLQRLTHPHRGKAVGYKPGQIMGPPAHSTSGIGHADNFFGDLNPDADQNIGVPRPGCGLEAMNPQPSDANWGDTVNEAGIDFALKSCFANAHLATKVPLVPTVSCSHRDPYAIKRFQSGKPSKLLVIYT